MTNKEIKQERGNKIAAGAALLACLGIGAGAGIGIDRALNSGNINISPCISTTKTEIKQEFKPAPGMPIEEIDLTDEDKQYDFLTLKYRLKDLTPFNYKDYKEQERQLKLIKRNNIITLIVKEDKEAQEKAYYVINYNDYLNYKIKRDLLLELTDEEEKDLLTADYHKGYCGAKEDKDDRFKQLTRIIRNKKQYKNNLHKLNQECNKGLAE